MNFRFIKNINCLLCIKVFLLVIFFRKRTGTGYRFSIKKTGRSKLIIKPRMGHWKLFLLSLILQPPLLCSCNSNTSHKPEKKPQEVVFKHENYSTHQLNETKVIDIRSSVILDFDKSIKSKGHSMVESDCFKSDLKTFSASSRIENISQLPIKDIISPTAFTPSLNPQSELQCDFKIEVFESSQKIAIILLNDIRITNVETFENLSLPLTSAYREDLYIKKKTLENIKIIVPLNRGEIMTLCEESAKTHPFRGRVLSISDFFSEELFKKKNLSLCRLVVHQKNPSKTQVSRSFFVQGKEPQVTYEYEENYKAGGKEWIGSWKIQEF